MRNNSILKRGRFSLEKKIAVIALVVVLLIIAAVCLYQVFQITESAQKPVVTEPYAILDNQIEGILLNKETNNETEYSFEVLSYDEIENEFLRKWMDNSIADETTDGENPVYYALHNNSSDNLDIYLFMPAANLLMGDVILSSVKVTEAGTTLLIYVDTDEQTTHTKESKDLIIHIQAISGNATAKNERLIINTETYYCANTTFTVLG